MVKRLQASPRRTLGKPDSVFRQIGFGGVALMCIPWLSKLAALLWA
jgi:hypothetical protein